MYKRQTLDLGYSILLGALRELETNPDYRFALDQTCYIGPFLRAYPEERDVYKRQAIGAETKVQDMRTLIGAVTWLCGAAALALCGCPKQGPAVAGLDPISVTRERIESAQLATPPRPPVSYTHLDVYKRQK